MAKDEYTLEMKAEYERALAELEHDDEPTDEQLDELNAWFDRLEATCRASVASFHTFLAERALAPSAEAIAQIEDRLTDPRIDADPLAGLEGDTLTLYLWFNAFEQAQFYARMTPQSEGGGARSAEGRAA